MRSKRQINDDDTKREIRNVFTKTNTLARKFSNCSIAVYRLSCLKPTVHAYMMLVHGSDTKKNLITN